MERELGTGGGRGYRQMGQRWCIRHRCGRDSHRGWLAKARVGGADSGRGLVH